MEASDRILRLCDRLRRLAEETEAAARPVYPDLEPDYRELERLIRAPTPRVVAGVLAHPDVIDAAPRLHALRAMYEYEQEMAFARDVLSAEDALARLRHYVEQERHWADGPELRSVLTSARKILVAGSGPMPLTALHMAEAGGRAVVSVDRNAEACRIGRAVLALTPLGGAIECVESDVVDCPGLETFDTIVAAVLLGVGQSVHTKAGKARAVAAIVDRMGPDARLVLRDPHGLGHLLYPAAELQPNGHVDVDRYVPDVAPDRPYRSAIAVVRRQGGLAGRADASTL